MAMGPHCCSRPIRAAKAARTHPRAPADLLRRWKLGRTTQAISAGTGGANVYVLRPSIGATSLGHWKSSSLEAAGGAADGVLDPIKGAPLTHREGCPSSQPSLQDVWSPCHHPSPPPGHGSAEHFPVCRGDLLPGSRWKDLLLCSPKDSAVVIFLS